MEPVLEMPLTVAPRGSGERLRSLHGQLRTAILEGRLRPGLRLPSTRALADAHGVSRNTAMAAYELLLSEGYLATRQGAGTYVADVLPDLPVHRPVRERPVTSDRRLNPFWRRTAVSTAAPRPPVRFDFRLGIPDINYLPLDVWRRLSGVPYVPMRGGRWTTARCMGVWPCARRSPGTCPTLVRSRAGRMTLPSPPVHSRRSIYWRGFWLLHNARLSRWKIPAIPRCAKLSRRPVGRLSACRLMRRDWSSSGFRRTPR